VTSAAFDRSGRLLVTASTDGTARTWDPLPRQRITVFTEPSASAIRCAIVSGDQVVTGSADGYIRVWSLATGKPLMTMREPGGGAINDVEEFVPFSDINSLTLSAGPLKELLLTASSDGTARVWNADNGRATGVVLREPGGASINAVRTTTDNRLILTASSDGTARVWSETNGRPTGQVFTPGDGGGLTSIEFDSGFSPQTLQETGVPGLTIPTPEAPGFPDVGSHLLLTDRSGQATIWSLTTNKETAVITEPGRAAIDAGAFDGRYVMTASEDGTVRIWNPSADPYTTDSPPVTSWAPRLTMAEPGGSSIDTAALDSGDNLIVTGSVDGYARVWDAATGKALAGFQPSGQVLAASFGASGQGVIVVSSDGSASMWSIIPARTVPRLRALAESLLPPRLSGQDQSYLARVSG
jgi:WD40 repeat protein